MGDPPYVHESRSDTKAYAFEMSDAQHRRLMEPDSAVSQPLKELFLALRRAAELDMGN